MREGFVFLPPLCFPPPFFDFSSRGAAVPTKSDFSESFLLFEDLSCLFPQFKTAFPLMFSSFFLPFFYFFFSIDPAF